MIPNGMLFIPSTFPYLNPPSKFTEGLNFLWANSRIEIRRSDIKSIRYSFVDNNRRRYIIAHSLGEDGTGGGGERNERIYRNFYRIRRSLSHCDTGILFNSVHTFVFFTDVPSLHYGRSDRYNVRRRGRSK